MIQDDDHVQRNLRRWEGSSHGLHVNSIPAYGCMKWKKPQNHQSG